MSLLPSLLYPLFQNFHPLKCLYKHKLTLVIGVWDFFKIFTTVNVFEKKKLWCEKALVRTNLVTVLQCVVKRKIKSNSPQKYFIFTLVLLSNCHQNWLKQNKIVVKIVYIRKFSFYFFLLYSPFVHRRVTI